MYGKYLPNAYQSAKSVLVKAKSKGIDITGKGKTELQTSLKKIKEASITDYYQYLKTAGEIAKKNGLSFDDAKLAIGVTYIRE